MPAALAADPAQRTVIAHSGPLLVLGGPGTGKTSTLVECVAQRVAEGADPGRVLVWAFSRRSAAALKDRISARVASVGTVAEPLVRTPHGYAFSLLRLAASRRGDPAPKLITGPEQDLIIRELIRGALEDGREDWPADLRPALLTRGFATELRDLLLRAVERGIAPGQLAAWGRQHGRADWVAAARFLDEYIDVRLLRDPSGYDPAELIRAAIGELNADPELLADERARLQHVYADEVQDTDPAQLELLRLVTATAIGFADPASATFTFRGADPEGLRTFAPETVHLGQSWRQGGKLFAATSRIRLRGAVARRPAPGPLGGDFEVALLHSVSEEANFIAYRLRAAHLLTGIPWSRMAVVVRSTAATLGPLRRALSMAGVPVEVAADDLPLPAQPAVRALLTLIACAVEPGRLDDETALMLVRSPFGGADPLAERRLAQAGPLPALIAEPPPEQEAADWAGPVHRISSLLRVARDTAGSIEDILWAVWQESGLAGRWEAAALGGGDDGAAADRDLDAVVALFETAGRFTDRLPGAGASLFLDHILGQELPADSAAPSADRGEAVRILTAHSAKGLEWDVVAVAGVQEGIWPNLKPRGSLLGSEHLVDIAAGRAGTSITALLDEERRLFHVAVTRAAKKLIVTAVADREEQPSRFLDELQVRSELPETTVVSHARLPRSLTLAGVVAELRGRLPDPEAARQLAALADHGVPGAHPDEWWGLPALSDDRPLALPGERARVSPSTVDTVLTCGLRWLLGRHGGDVPSPAGSIGTLVHFAAELSAQPGISRAEIFDEVRRRYAQIDTGAKWYSQRQWSDVESMIDRLLAWGEGRQARIRGVETAFTVDFGDGVELAGRVDRLEADDQGRLVVYDFKTGRAAEDAEASKQLATYQAAIEAGAFGPAGPSGGAALVRLRLKDPEKRQRPLADAEDPAWGRKLVEQAGETVRGATVMAIAGDHCRSCPVRSACPLHAPQVIS
ncbi:ATP-dependent DNA helicase [Longispora albida]|uniref:ATP-dependent helicase n=1 Tax=Longispora albida TaxID=203523 RepID=UPI00058B146F